MRTACIRSSRYFFPSQAISTLRFQHLIPSASFPHRFTSTTTTSSSSASSSPSSFYHCSSQHEAIDKKKRLHFLFNFLLTAGLAFALAEPLSDKKHEVKAQAKQQKTTATDTELTPKEFRPFKLREVHNYNHNTKAFVFNVPQQADTEESMPVSSFVLFQYKDQNGKLVTRPYTPIRTNTPNELTFLIKEYPDGKMSKYISSLKPGDEILLKGPLPKLKYERNMKKRIGMIAGGTGITPMAQVLEKILEETDDRTQVDLVFANTSPQDILLKELLDNFARYKPNQFRVHYTVDKATTADGQQQKWNGRVGYVDEKLLKQTMPPASMGKDALIYVCGPPGFMLLVSGDKAKDYTQGKLTGLLAQIGFKEEQVYKF